MKKILSILFLIAMLLGLVTASYAVDDNTKLIVIDNSNAYSSKFKNILYLISDTFNNLLDFISNIIVG